MSSIWRPLPSTAGLHATAALLKYSLAPPGFSVHLTDLSQVWSEELSKEGICERARSTDSSIDPTENDDQLHILSNKIEAALRGDENTSISIAADGADHITLTLTSPLPEPLPPLTWVFRLGPGSREKVKTEVMVPLVCSTYMRKQQQDDLVTLIAHKDILINKLVDKLESIGSDLASLYPTLARIRPGKNQRQELVKHVKGLGAFDEGPWRRDFDSKVHDGLAFSDMSEVAFRESGTKAVTGSIQSLEPTVFKPLPELLNTGVVKKAKLLREETKDEFQHQITPKKIRKRRARASGVVADDDETTDDGETMSPTPGPRSARTPFRNSSPIKPSSVSAQKLGRIGGTKRADLQSTTKPALEDTRTVREASASSDTASVQSRERSFTKSVSESPLKSRESVTTNRGTADLESNKSRKNFGKIGGEPKTPAPAPTEETSPTSATPEPGSTVHTTPPRPRQQLSRLGGRRSDPNLIAPVKRQEMSQHKEFITERDTDEPAAQVRDVPAPTRTPTPQPEQVEESQEERASRHRAELKREVSMVKKPPPKRRKF